MHHVAQCLLNAAAFAEPYEVDEALEQVVLEGLRDEFGVDENDLRDVDELLVEVKRRC